MKGTITPPTEKQVKAAEIIAKKLHLNLPEEKSKAAYWEFISKNMAASKCVKRHNRYSCTAKYASRSTTYTQRETDWEAIHLSPDTWAERIMDGKTIPPSWANESLQQAQRRLRSLGYKSSLEKENEQLRERLSGCYGLEGAMDMWGY